MHKKTVVITGVSSGIGESLAREFINRGLNVIGIARREDKLQDLKEELGNSFSPFICDISDKNQILDTFSLLQSLKIKPFVFFLNAGIAGEDAAENDNFNLEKHEKIMSVNYFGVLSFIQGWKNAGMPQTHFIVTSSINALWAPPNGSAYAASKAAISKAFDGLSLTFSHSKTKFSSLYCGPVQTKGLKGSLPFAWSPEKMALYMADFAQGKKKRKYPSLFYYFLCHILNALPKRWVSKWFGTKS